MTNMIKIEEQKINEYLTKYNIQTESGISSSETDYGISHYFFVINSISNCETKVRVSDHPATNSVRQEREIMLNLTDKDFQKLEKITHPERFDITLEHINTGRNVITVKKYTRIIN